MSLGARVRHQLRGWVYWLPSYSLAAVLAGVLRPMSADWLEHAIYYAFFPVFPFLVGYWLTAAAASSYNPKARALAGFIASSVITIYGLFKG